MLNLYKWVNTCYRTMDIHINLFDFVDFSLDNLMEMDCFVKAFHLMARITPEDKLFHEPCKKAYEEAEIDVGGTDYQINQGPFPERLFHRNSH